jgi:hypothetical protein
MTLEPPAPAENTPSQPTQASDQPQPVPARAPRRSQVQMSFVLAPGTRIRVRVESIDAQGNVAAAQTVTAVQPGASEVTVPLLAQGEAINLSNLANDADAKEAWPEQGFIRPALPAARPGWRWQGLRGGKVLARLGAWLAAKPILARIVSPAGLFGLTLFVYLLTRLTSLVNFPIYYSADEASCTVYAADFVANGFHDNYGEFMPTFFKHDERYNEGIIVYIQAVAFLFAGKSIFVSRLVIVLASLLGAIWISLILRDIFKVRYWWLGAVFLTATPAWFLFSRGVYDVCLMASLYAGFLYFYLLYRTRSPRYLYLALLLGALTFYSYTSGEIVMVVTGLLLLVSDIRYHWQQRLTALKGLGVLILLALPFVRFILAHPTEYAARVDMYGSYVGRNISIIEKALTFLGKLLAGLNPLYWFFPNSQDLPMYVMKGYGHLLWPMLPFALLGLWLVLRNIRRSEYRTMLLALLAVPTAPALVTMAVYRALAIIIPLVLLTMLGFSACLEWLEKKRARAGALAAYVALLVLVVFSAGMLRDALVNGPRWFRDYGIDGMQWGSSQVFTTARDYAVKNPNTLVSISPNWTFTSEVLRLFYVADVQNIIIGTADAYMADYKTGIENVLFVLTPGDYEKTVNSNWFTSPQIEKIISYPDGNPGFYFVRLQYRDDIEQIVAAEKEKRLRLIEQDITLNGEQVHVSYSPLDAGPIDNAFDGDPGTLVKSGGANPLVIVVEFPTVHQLSGLTVKVGSEPVQVTVLLTGDGGNDLGKFVQGAEGNVNGFKDVNVDFSGALAVKKLRFELWDIYAPVPSNVHAWEITFR